MSESTRDPIVTNRRLGRPLEIAARLPRRPAEVVYYGVRHQAPAAPSGTASDPPEGFSAGPNALGALPKRIERRNWSLKRPKLVYMSHILTVRYCVASPGALSPSDSAGIGS